MKNQIDAMLEVHGKIDECPICKNKLEKKSDRTILCPVCGFKVIVRTRKTDQQFCVILLLCTTLVYAVGIIVGFACGVVV